MFNLVQTGDIKYLTIPAFEETGTVTHAFSTRLGGVSPEPYTRLNLGFNTGDDPDNVRENRRRICRTLGIEPGHVVAGRQVHGASIAVVSEKDRGKGAFFLDSAIPETDALITAEPGVPLASFYADCVAVFLLDPVKGAIGLAHAGWKGTFLKIAARTAERMGELFRSNPGDLLIGIGPSIGSCCYEVDLPVINRLREAFRGYEDTAVRTGPDKWHLDLWEINRRQLADIGVPPEQITISRFCTNCRTDLFYSYRAENGITGRMGAILMLT